MGSPLSTARGPSARLVGWIGLCALGRGGLGSDVIDALEANWSRFEAKGVSDLGILIDWCGLYQAPRDDEQQRVFGAALKAINQARSRPCPGARHMHTQGHTGCRMAQLALI